MPVMEGIEDALESARMSVLVCNERSSSMGSRLRQARTRAALPFTAVELMDNLWAPRQRAVREHTVPFLHAQYEKNGLFEALDVDSPPEGPSRTDS
jgi:hypothetical protein